jgi:hypothetical protein
MPALRPWYVIPALGLASAAAAFAASHQTADALAIGACGAALAAAIRAFLGPSGVAAVAAAAGAALGVLALITLAPPVRAALAGAAGLFAIAELARPKQPHESPLPAVGAALLAAGLDPSYVALVAVAGAAWLRAPVSRPRAAVLIPILGVIATGFACACAIAYSKTSLWHTWLGHATYPRDLVTTLVRTGDNVGPIAVFAAAVGLVACLAHGRFAAAAVVSVIAVTAIASLAGGFVAPAAPLVAALGAGVAIGRFAALVKWPVGQAFVGATTGFVLVCVPVWSLLATI